MTTSYRKGDLVYIPSSVSMVRLPSRLDEFEAVPPVPRATYTTKKPSHYLVIASKLNWLAVYHEGNTWWVKNNEVYEAEK
jgi:hypothetical protein